ncbi:MAG: hypothetical protein HY370_06095 [Proteobacteria bacterium]|nr:hypothetical protein [Pseudomonadota bacterium]
MQDDDFLQELGLPLGYDLDRVEQRFVEHIKKRIQIIAENYREETIAAEENWLRKFYGYFFQYALHWAEEEAKKSKEKPNHPDAPKLKLAARETIHALQQMIVEFSQCYLRLNCFMTLVRNVIKSEEVRLGIQGNIRWTADAGIVLDRNKKMKKKLLDDIRRYQDARETIDKIEAHLSNIGQALENLLGSAKKEKFMRSIVAALRTADSKKAATALKNIAQEKKKFTLDQKKADVLQKIIADEGNALTGLVFGNIALLRGGDGKLFLRRSETDIAHNANIHELRKIKAFLAKYHLPYMEYKLDTLQLMRDKLLVIGSLESLMTIYRRLVAGIALPMPDIKDVKIYEGEVVNNVKWLLDGRYQEIPKILSWANEVVAEFRQGRDDQAEMENMPLEEISVIAAGSED